MIPKKLSLPHEWNLLENHFLNVIKGEDRRLRFGGKVSDDYVEDYLDKSSEMYGCKNMWFIVEDRGEVVASCHVAFNDDNNTAELGLTVSPDYRNQKIGQELYNRGATWARMRGAETIFMHCLSENKTIQHIAQKSGMTVVTYDYGEKEGTIKVNKSPSLAKWEDTVWENMAVYDASIRRQTWFFKNFMKVIGFK